MVCRKLPSFFLAHKRGMQRFAVVLVSNPNKAPFSTLLVSSNIRISTSPVAERGELLITGSKHGRSSTQASKQEGH